MWMSITFIIHTNNKIEHVFNAWNNIQSMKNRFKKLLSGL